MSWLCGTWAGRCRTRRYWAGSPAITGMLRMESVLAAIREKFPAKIAAANAAAAQEAFDLMTRQLAAGGDSACFGRLKDRERWRKRWRCAGRR